MAFRRVLIVEDENDVREVVAEIVTLIGFEARSCPDAETALIELEKSTFDLVITDLGLPGLDGAEFMTRMRLSDKDTPILVIAGVDLSQSDINMRKMTNWDFVQKPFTLDSIRRKMAELLQKSEKALSKKKLNKGQL